MKTILHPAEKRGFYDHGWLKTHHSFSFASYFDPQKIQFGVLRVLNDDIVEGGKGFGRHPHNNMEIVTIPLKGALEHMDSTGRHKVIRHGEVQIMSAGTGIEHSEFNASRTEEVNILQIWILPDKKDIDPRYDQKEFDLSSQRDSFITVVSPDAGDKGALWINQQAWFNLGKFNEDTSAVYQMRDFRKNGIYLFVIEGQVKVGEEILNEKDAAGFYELDKEHFEMTFSKASKALLLEVKMTD